MTSALARVDWTDLLHQLTRARADEPADDLAWCIRHRGPLLRPAHAALALLAVQNADTTAAIVGTHIGAWTTRTGRAALATFDLPAPDPRVPRFTPPVYADPRLPALPLLYLATLWATREQRHLIIRQVDLGPLCAGRHTDHGRDALVEISPNTRDAVGVWCHEFSHAVDPNRYHGPERGERFADTLGALLNRWRPRTLDRLDELVREATDTTSASMAALTAARGDDHAVGTADTTHAPSDLPDPGLPSLMAFAALPIDLNRIG